jgi:hypothetical protein
VEITNNAYCHVPVVMTQAGDVPLEIVAVGANGVVGNSVYVGPSNSVVAP